MDGGRAYRSLKLANTCFRSLTQYYKDPAATRRAFRGGWVHTGDLGYIDAEGFVYLVDRSKEMVIRGGENICELS